MLLRRLSFRVSRFSLAKFAGDRNSGAEDSAAANGEHPDESAASRLLESYSVESPYPT